MLAARVEIRNACFGTPSRGYFYGVKVLNETDIRLNVKNDTFASVSYQVAYNVYAILGYHLIQ